MMSIQERNEKMGDELKRKNLDRFLYSPPGGESLADVCFRAEFFLDRLHRECENKRVVCVVHGEVMWAMRFRLERMTLLKFHDLISSKRFSDQIHHGQILWYSRKNPMTGELSPRFEWMKSVCPWDVNRSQNEWKHIERIEYDNNMLMATASQVPRMIQSSSSPSASPYAMGDQLPTPANLDLHLENAQKRRIKDDIDRQKKEEQARQLYVDPSLAKNAGLNLNRIILVDKKTRYEVERDHYNCEGEQLRQQLVLRGIVYDRLKTSHEAHKMATENILKSLDDKGSRVDMLKVNETDKIFELEKKREQLASRQSKRKERQEGGSLRDDEGNEMHEVSDDLLQALSLEDEQLDKDQAFFDGIYPDIVMSAGGDGTFLSAAQAIQTSALPLLGINTDPTKSQGSLCCCSLDLIDDERSASQVSSTPFSPIVERLLDGRFHYFPHTRLQIQMVDSEGEHSSSCCFNISSVCL